MAFVQFEYQLWSKRRRTTKGRSGSSSKKAEIHDRASLIHILKGRSLSTDGAGPLVPEAFL